MLRPLFSALIFWVGLSLPVGAEEKSLVTFKILTLDAAMEMAQASLADCRKRGYQVTIAVVDRFGTVQVILRDRFAGPHTPETARRKAWTAISFRTDTLSLAGLTQAGKEPSGVRFVSEALMVGGGVPGEEGFKALVLDLADAKKNRTAGQVGTRLNYERSGTTSLLKSSARKATRIKGPPFKDKLLEFRKDWDDPYLWSVMERAARSHTVGFYAPALDFTFDKAGDLERVAPERQIYVLLFTRTLFLSALIASGLASADTF